MVERVVHRPESGRERETVGQAQNPGVLTWTGEPTPTCRGAGVRGMWLNVAASACDATEHDDDWSPSDRSIVG